MLGRVTSTQIGHIFARVTRAGEASRRPYAEKFDGFGGSQQSHLKFQIKGTAKAKEKAKEKEKEKEKEKADPSPLKRVRDDSLVGLS